MDGPLRAEGFEVVDEEGRVRARMGLLHEDRLLGATFGIGLYDEEGRARAWLGLGPGGPSLVFDEGGDTAVLIGVSDEIDPGDLTGALLVMTDAEGEAHPLWPGVLEFLARVGDDDEATRDEEDER